MPYPSRMANAEDVFVSYSREDKEKVLELTAKLRAAGVPLWIDLGGIDGAAMWGEEIVNALAKRQGSVAVGDGSRSALAQRRQGSGAGQ